MTAGGLCLTPGFSRRKAARLNPSVGWLVNGRKSGESGRTPGETKMAGQEK
jgi:hypothetical protein